MTFEEMIKEASTHPGRTYKRTDYDAQWCLFCDHRGRLKQLNIEAGAVTYPELYAHDVCKDATWGHIKTPWKTGPVDRVLP